MAENVSLNIQIGMQDNASRSVKTLESNIIRFVGAVSAALAAVKITLFPITEAVEFEAALKNVQKTTNFATDEVNRLGDAFLEMARSIGVSSTELASIAAIAGQLGLGQEGRQAIEDFTQSVAIASVTLGVTAEEASNAGAQIKSIFNLPVDNLENVFSVINELSNNSVAAASDIIDIVKRVGTAADATFPQVAALAATMRDVGVPNEQAGTALVKFLTRMLSEADKFADAVGLSTKDWVNLVKKDSVEALKFVLTSLSDMRTDAAKQAATIEKLFGAGRLTSAATKLVKDAGNNFEILTKNLKNSEAEFVRGTSSLREYEVIMDAVGKKAEVLSGAFSALGIEVGQQSLPEIKKGLEELTEVLSSPEVIDFFIEVGESLSGLVQAIINAGKAVAKYSDLVDELIAVFKIWLALTVGGKLLNFFRAFSASLTAGAKSGSIFVRTIQKIADAFKTLAVANAAGGLAAGSLGPSIGALGAGVVASFKSAAESLKVFLFLSKELLIAGKGILAVMGLLTQQVLLFLATPLGVVLALAGLAVLFWDEISEFLGIVDEETAKRRAEARNARRESLAQLREDADAFKTAIDRVKKIADTPIDLEKTLATGSGAMSKAIQQVTKDMNALSIAQNTADGSGKLIIRRSREIESEIARVSQQLVIQKRIRDSIRPTGRNLSISSESELRLRDTNKLIKDTEAILETLNKGLEKSKKNLQDQVDTYDTIQQKLEIVAKSAKGLELAEQIDFKLAITEVEILTEEIEKLNKERRELVGQGDDAKIPEVGTAQFSELARINSELADKQDTLTDATKKAEVAQAALQEVRELTLDQIAKESLASQKNMRQQRKDARDTATTLGQHKNAIQENSEEIIRQAAVAEALRIRWGAVGTAIEDFNKRVRGAFDNTATELAGINSRIDQFVNSFKRSISGRDAELKIEAQIKSLGPELEQQKKEINEHADFLQSVADNQVEFDIFEDLRQSRLQEAELASEVKQQEIEAKALQEEFNAVLARRTELMDKARALASKVGASVQEIDEARSIKKLAEGLSGDLQGLLEQMRDAKKTLSEGGKTTQIRFFSTEALLQNLEEIKKLKPLFQEEVTDINARSVDAAKTITEAYSNAAGIIEKQAQQTKGALLPILNSVEGVAGLVKETAESLVAELPGVTQDLAEISDNVLFGPNTTAEGIKLFDSLGVVAGRSMSKALLSDSDFIRAVQGLEFKDQFTAGGDGAVINVTPDAPAFVKGFTDVINNSILPKVPLDATVNLSNPEQIAESVQRAVSDAGGSVPVGIKVDKPTKQIEEQIEQGQRPKVDLELKPIKGESIKIQGKVPVNPVVADVTGEDFAETAGKIPAQVAPVVTQDAIRTIKEDIESKSNSQKPAPLVNMRGDLDVKDLRDRIEREGEQVIPLKVKGEFVEFVGVKLSEEGNLSFFKSMQDSVKRAVEATNIQSIEVEKIDIVQSPVTIEDAVAVLTEVDTSSIEGQVFVLDLLARMTLDEIAAAINVAEEQGLELELLAVLQENLLKQQFQDIQFTATVARLNLPSGATNIGVPGFASGGSVKGPGTSTSDSILAWLSNGEYIMDAATTRFFGSSFFAGLQSFAKSGSGPGSKLGLPAFAGGGLAGIPSVSFDSGSGIIEKVEVNINNTSTNTSNRVLTDREGARQLVDALKQMRG